LMGGNHDLRVLHVPGEENQVADALSRGDFARAIRLHPQLENHISRFAPYQRSYQNSTYTLQPPLPMLGATQQ
jgi:hypothetical protein